MNKRTTTDATSQEAHIYDQSEGFIDATPTSGIIKRISWGAVIAGAVVVLATQLLLSMLGIGIGASTISPTTQQNPTEGLGTGAAIWFGVSTLLSLFLGGMVAGRLAGMPLKTDSTLHGVLVWGVSTLLTFYLLTTAIGGLIGGTASILGKGLSVAGQTAATATTAAGNAAGSNPDAVGAAEDKLGQLKDQATAKVDQLKDQASANAPEIDDRARAAGGAAASGVSKAALSTFFILLLGALAAAFGGRQATPRNLAAPRSTSKMTL